MQSAAKETATQRNANQSLATMWVEREVHVQSLVSDDKPVHASAEYHMPGINIMCWHGNQPLASALLTSSARQRET